MASTVTRRRESVPHPILTLLVSWLAPPHCCTGANPRLGSLELKASGSPVICVIGRLAFSTSCKPVTRSIGISGMRIWSKMPDWMADASNTSLLAMRTHLVPLDTIQSPAAHLVTPSISVVPGTDTS
ncbi:hypothetical protein D3C75_839980 [compost metagenome]